MSLMRRVDSFFVLAMLIAAFAAAPLLAPGYFWGAHDARHSVYFLVEFDRSILDGVFYPRWSPDFNFGYGYPFFNIYSPGAFYLGEALHLLGLDFVAATKGVFALSLILSAAAMYLYARRVLGSPPAALIAAAVYVYVPYHLADVYLRGALADSLCFVFFPLVLLGFHRLVLRPHLRALLVAGATLAALLFSHYPLALLFLPVLGLYVLTVSLTARRFRDFGEAVRLSVRPLLWAAGAVAYALALAAILILPAALEYGSVRTDQWASGYYSYKDHFVYFFQFFAPTWGYGAGSVAGPNDTLPFQLGAVAVTLTILSVLARFFLLRGSQGDQVRAVVTFHQMATVGLMLLMLDVSAPIWEALRLASFAQFPWRLLSLTAVTMALLSGVPLLVNEQQGSPLPMPLVAAVLAVVVLGSYSFLQPQLIDPPEGPVSLGGLMRFQQASGEMTGMTAWATRPRPPSWSPLADVYVSGGEVTDKVMRDQLPANVQATTLRHTTVLEEVKVSAAQPVTIAFYTAYYPGWQATVDGQAAQITPVGDLGHITVPVPAGEHTLVLRFGDTLPRTIGAILTIVAGIAGAIVMVRKR